MSYRTYTSKFTYINLISCTFQKKKKNLRVLCLKRKWPVTTGHHAGHKSQGLIHTVYFTFIQCIVNVSLCNFSSFCSRLLMYTFLREKNSFNNYFFSKINLFEGVDSDSWVLLYFNDYYVYLNLSCWRELIAVIWWLGNSGGLRWSVVLD